MRFYPKWMQKKTDVLIDRLSTGHCDGTLVIELKAAVSENSDPAEMERMITAITDIAMKSDNPVSVAYSVKSLVSLRPLTAGLEDDLERRLQTLAADRDAMASKPLREALAEFIYIRVSERVDRALPFIDALIMCLDERAGTGGTAAYNTLMTVAANQPEYFEGRTGPLVKMLGSINNVTRIQTSRLIAVLAISHPEYVADAEKILLHHSSFNPDAEVKNAASEAYQILSSRLHPEEKGHSDDSAERHRYEQEQSSGLAGIMRQKVGKDKKATGESRIDKRLLSLATNFARKGDRAYDIKDESPEHQDADREAITRIIDDFSRIAESIKAEAEPADQPEKVERVPAARADTAEEAELRKIMEMVQDDFSITAGSILDAIGVGHLTKMAVTGEAKHGLAEAASPEHARHARVPRTSLLKTTKAQEMAPSKNEIEQETSPKELIDSTGSIISRANEGQLEQMATESIATRDPASMSPTVIENTVTEIGSPAVSTPEKPVAGERKNEPEKKARTPVAPARIQISAVKFKPANQPRSKKPAPARISIKSHIKIKPLDKHPVNATKIVSQPKQHPASLATGIKSDNSPDYILCHSCGAKMLKGIQRCETCGSDLKSPKA